MQQTQTAQPKPMTGATTTMQAGAKPVQTANQPMKSEKKKSMWWLWLMVILVSLGIGFLLGYFLF